MTLTVDKWWTVQNLHVQSDLSVLDGQKRKDTSAQFIVAALKILCALFCYISHVRIYVDLGELAQSVILFIDYEFWWSEPQLQ